MSARVYPSLDDVTAFRPDRFHPIVLAESDRTKVILACFEPVQFIPVHRPGVDLTLVVLAGEGRMVVGDEEHPLRPGTVAFVPAGEARGVLAESRLVVLHVVTPPPTEADHAEVESGLRRGTWR